MLKNDLITISGPCQTKKMPKYKTRVQFPVSGCQGELEVKSDKGKVKKTSGSLESEELSRRTVEQESVKFSIINYELLITNYGR
jgi:hypothetical protein